ncbi:MAG TPA: hypothetical protein VKD04_11235 [Burkholderiales bacterium]|nr:hypothetical protein [Burkholderiales bacterium]
MPVLNILLSEPLFRLSDERIRTHTRPLPREFEGLGPVQTYFIDIEDVAGGLPPRPKVTRLGRFRETGGVIIRTLPYRAGLRKLRFAL